MGFPHGTSRQQPGTGQRGAGPGWAPLCLPGAAAVRGEGGAARPRPRPRSALPGLVLPAGRQSGRAVSIPRY